MANAVHSLLPKKEIEMNKTICLKYLTLLKFHSPR